MSFPKSRRRSSFAGARGGKSQKGIVLLEARRQADISLWLYDSGRLLGEIEAVATTRSHAEFDLSQAQDALQSLEVQNQRPTEMNRGSRKRQDS